MNLSQAAKNISWVTSHPECRSHPFLFPMRVLRWEWHRAMRKPARLPLYDFVIQARPSDGVGRLICYFRDRADQQFAFMKRYLKPGMTFVDVGANIGSHTVHGARLVMPEGKVFSFEADPDTFKLLEANLQLNGILNATLFNQCVSDKSEQVVFNVNANSARSSLLRPGSSQISLSADTLDRLLPPGLQVDLLKIDVEGGDYLVLKGARKMFESSPPRVVIIEATSSKTDIQDLFLSYGYRLYEFDDTSSALVELKSPVFDTYAVRDDMRRAISGLAFSGPTP